MLGFWYWFKRRANYSFKPVIVITGCASGIGRAIAELLIRQNSYRVVVTAREHSLKRMTDLFKEGENLWIRSLDITRADQRDELIAEITREWGGVNILINCAGISYRAVMEHMTEQDEHRQMETNYFGPIALIRAVLPFMRQQGRGKIINISSVSGILAMPTMASYTASKYALEGASEALWYEMKPLGISVSLVQPGFVRSDSYKNVYYTELSKKAEGEGTQVPYGDYYSNMAPFIDRLMNLSPTRPAAIAKLVLKVIKTQNPPLWIPATFDAFIFYYLRRFVPRRILLTLLFWNLPKVRRWGERYSMKRR